MNNIASSHYIIASHVSNLPDIYLTWTANLTNSYFWRNILWNQPLYIYKTLLSLPQSSNIFQQKKSWILSQLETKLLVFLSHNFFGWGMAIINKKLRKMGSRVGHEVAPPMFISHKRYSRSCRLETIHEEAHNHHRHHHSSQILAVPSNKRVLFLLPVFVSLAFSFMLYTNI